MLKTFPIALLALLFAFVSSGCDGGGEDDTPPPPPAILVQGSYTGTANVNGAAVTLTLTLAENSNNLTGSGILRGSEVISLSAVGTHVGSDFNLTLSNNAFEDLNFAGTVSGAGAVLNGVLNGSGFDSVGITLNRGSAAAPMPSTTSSKEAPSSRLLLDAVR